MQKFVEISNVWFKITISVNAISPPIASLNWSPKEISVGIFSSSESIKISFSGIISEFDDYKTVPEYWNSQCVTTFWTSFPSSSMVWLCFLNSFAAHALSSEYFLYFVQYFKFEEMWQGYEKFCERWNYQIIGKTTL